MEALHYQKKMREKKLGTILKEERMITEAQLLKSLRLQKKKAKLLGEILIEAQYITSEQLEEALIIQRKNRSLKLGQILVELKYVSPNDICLAVATQFHFPWIDLSKLTIPHEVVTALPEHIMRTYEVIPIQKKEEDILVVATSQPQFSDIWLEVRKSTLMRVELVVAFEGHIENQINEHFPVSGN